MVMGFSEGDSESVGDGWAGEIAFDAVDSAEEFWAFGYGCCDAIFGDESSPVVGDVVESLGGGSCVGAWHVGDAVVDDTFLDVGGVCVGGSAGGFSAAALVYSDVNEDAAGLHEA